MSAIVRHVINSNSFWLSPQRCMYWEEQQTLILSDLHFGKTGHFRKSGIAIPQAVYKEDLQRLFSEIQFYQPKQLIIVGDLFHSRENKEMELFTRWRDNIQHIPLLLVKGNHDILKDNWYKQSNIEVIRGHLNIDNFLFTHDICEHVAEPHLYCFSGHVHPGVIIKGAGKQALKFPCYYFGKEHAVLPAFSKFTGIGLIEPKEKEFVFAIVEHSVIALNN